MMMMMEDRVPGGLILQSRQAAADFELAQRTIHTDLLAKAVDDPELRACQGSSIHGKLEKKHFYTNSIVSFWASMFEIGKIGEDELRLLAGSMFPGAEGSRYSSIAAPLRRSADGSGRRDRRFTAILDEEYLRVRQSKMLVIGFVDGVLLSAIGAPPRRSYRPSR